MLKQNFKNSLSNNSLLYFDILTDKNRKFIFRKCSSQKQKHRKKRAKNNLNNQYAIDT